MRRKVKPKLGFLVPRVTCAETLSSLSSLVASSSASQVPTLNGVNSSLVIQDAQNNTRSKLLSDLTENLENWVAPEKIRRGFPYYLSGYDDDDRPIWVLEMGRYNVRQAVEEGGETLQALEMWMQQCAYRVMKSAIGRGTPGDENRILMFLIDADGLELSQLTHLPTLGFFLRQAFVYSKLIQDYLGATIIVNANYVAQWLINLSRPVFGHAMERVEVYGTNKATWIPQLRRKFPPDAIPPWYGGICTPILQSDLLNGKLG
ncbi:unnamed protein product [Allacma fusca]|uniref:CRAL-TRIO domain-containing protein n=1 Tax=Allacma fusca TaxID=39272 RepID=A0A8J2LVN7_9HEXA|nr:unnamed protein product [Allacma fusca]